MNLPKEPIMLYSYINTQLRDNYSSLSEFAASVGADEKEITDILADAGFRYDSEGNRFVQS